MLKTWLTLVSLWILASCSMQPAKTPVGTIIPARFETVPVSSSDDAADDPAIWVHPDKGQNSLILGTDKNSESGGIYVYNLEGKKLHFIPDPGVNNIDIRYAIPFYDTVIDLAVASRRTNNTLAIYQVLPHPPYLKNLEPDSQNPQGDVYGLCLYQNPKNHEVMAFVPNKEGKMFQWVLELKDSVIEPRFLKRFQVKSQAEGCVADDVNGMLYVAEEEGYLRGIVIEELKMREVKDSIILGRPIVIDSVQGKHLKADIEGLALNRTCRPRQPGGQTESTQIIASSQGDNTFVIYSLASGFPLNQKFGITDPITGGRVMETDGIEVCTDSLSAAFPQGIMVVQDGDNGGDNQNFKIASWEDVK